MPHAAQAVSEDTVRLLGNPGRHISVGRSTMGWIVLEAAILGRIMRRRNDNTVGHPRLTAAVVRENRVGDNRSRRIAVVAIDHDLDTVGGQAPLAR
jgi:hypothetical protein